MNNFAVDPLSLYKINIGRTLFVFAEKLPKEITVKLKRNSSVIVSGLTFACLSALAMKPAHAGTWHMISRSVGDGPASISWPAHQDTTTVGQPNLISWLAYQGTNSSVSLNASGTFNATFYYVPSNANDPVPTSLVINEKPDAQVDIGIYTFFSGWFDGTNTELPTCSLNNGDGDTLTFYTEYDDEQNNLYWYVGDAIGLHLHSIPVTPSSGTIPGTTTQYTGIASFTTQPLSASASIGSLTQPGGSIDGVFTDTLQIDNRQVLISSSIDPTNTQVWLGTIDENDDPIYFVGPNKRKGDGSMKGDIGIDENDSATITYSATPVGSWAYYLSSWNWFSSEKQANSSGIMNNLPWNIETFSNVYVGDTVIYGSPTILQPSPDLNVTDHLHITYTNGDDTQWHGTPAMSSSTSGDGAVATGNYYMNLHEPDEFGKSNKIQVIIPMPITDLNILDPGYAAYGGGIPCTWNAPAAYWGDAENALSVASNGPYPPSLKWLGVFFAAVGIGVSDFSPKADNGTANYADGWTSPGSTWDGSTTAPSRTPVIGYHMTPSLMGAYWPTYTLHWTYDMTGYTGQELETSLDYRGIYYWVGTYMTIM